MPFRLRQVSLCVALLIISVLRPADANLMSVDLGLGYIKVAVARPGKGLELVINEQSKRKTPAAVGFTTEGERLFGDAAVAYAAKAPKRAILNGRDLIGRCDDADVTDAAPFGSPFCKRHRLQLDGIGQFTGEEVVAMLLAMAKRQASAALNGAPIKDIAVTVPAWYDERQRQAISDAARVLGLNCLGVVNGNTAAAIKYALDGKARPSDAKVEAEKAKDKKKRTPKTLSQRVLFYDIGSSSASASVAEVTSDVKTGVATSIRMLSHAWEKAISGGMLDGVVVERLADAFDKQRGAGATPARELPRVMMRLRKEAQRVREVLSANTDTVVSVGSLHDDVDLRTTLSRVDFESDAHAMLQLVGRPAKEALSDAGISAKDLDAVVPFGGASRTPRVQQEICSSVGVASLNKSINTDEAAVMGSAFFAASLSSTFRVRKMDVHDLYRRSVSVEIDRDTSAGGLFSGSGKKKGYQTVDVFPESGSKVPSKKTVSLNRKDDFAMRIFLNMDKTGKSRFPERTLYAKINVKGVADVLKKLKDSKKAKSETPRVALSFHLDPSGLLRVGTAEASVDETVIVEREVEIKEDKKKDKKDDKKDDKTDESTGESDAKDEKNMETAEKKSDEGEKDAKEDTKDEAKDETKDEAKDTKDEKAKKKTRIEKSTQTVVHRTALTIEFEESEGLHGMKLSAKELEAAQKVLNDLEAADLERVERADALNALEGYILEVGSAIRSADEDDALYQVSTEEERETLGKAFEEAEDWMYGPEASQTANLRNKHFELRKLFADVESRAKELAGRAGAFAELRTGVARAREQAVTLRAVHEERKSGKLAEVDALLTALAGADEWVNEKERAQAATALTEAPVVTIADIAAKGKELMKEALRVAKLELPPVITAPPNPDEDGAAASPAEPSDGGDGNATATDGSEGGDADSDEDGDRPQSPDLDAARAEAAGSAGAKDEL